MGQDESNVFLLAQLNVSGCLRLFISSACCFCLPRTIVTSAAHCLWFCFLFFCLLFHVFPCSNLPLDPECFGFAADPHQTRLYLNWQPVRVPSPEAESTLEARRWCCCVVCCVSTLHMVVMWWNSQEIRSSLGDTVKFFSPSGTNIHVDPRVLHHIYTPRSTDPLPCDCVKVGSGWVLKHHQHSEFISVSVSLLWKHWIWPNCSRLVGLLWQTQPHPKIKQTNNKLFINVDPTMDKILKLTR